MRIALDATPLIEPAGGLPRYTAELALALAELHPSDEIHLLSDQSALHIDERLRAAPNIVLDPPRNWGRSKWWSLGLPFELRRRRIDVFHGTNFEVPYLRLTPAVLTIHDLSPWKPPPLAPPGCDRVHSRTPRLIRLAQRVITPTEAVRKETLERFHLEASKVVAIPHAPSDALAPPPPTIAENLRRRLALPSCYLLAIGAGNERKNIPVLQRAGRAGLPSAPDLGLVVIGAGASAARDNVDARLVTLDTASDAETAAALSGAEAFVYPSLYEGFGLPLVEAMRAEVPVLASTDAALREVADGAALHFDPQSQDELTAAILRVLHDPEEAGRLVAQGRKRAAALSWQATARKTRATYEQVIRGA